MKALYCVTYDSMPTNSGHFVAHCHTGRIIFHQSQLGPYFHNMRESKTVAFTQYDVETVVNNAKGFTRPQLHSTQATRHLTPMTAHPSDANLLALVRCNMLEKCPIAAPNIATDKRVYGPNIAGVSRGKEVRCSPRPAVSDYIAVPPQIRKLNRVFDISADVMFINGLPFFLT